MPSAPGPPMTLGNMCELGVRLLVVLLAVLSAERWSDAVLVRAFRPRIGLPAAASSATDWREFEAQGVAC